jgi:thiamine kinase-like enzyme
MATAEEQVASLEFWSGGAVTLEPLSGGLSNESFVVTDGRGKYVARYGHDIAVHHVVRTREAELSRVAADFGISPRLHFACDGVMIFDFIEGHTFGADDLKTNLERSVDIVKRVHTEMHHKVRGPGHLFWVWHVLRDYAHLLRQGETPPPDLERLMAIAAVLEKDAGEPHICICHSDLLAANFIDDGHKLWLIDWEYGAFGNVWFDVGNTAAISDFDRQEETELLEVYLGHPATEIDWRRFDAMRCAANLRETLWGMVSEQHLELDIDYQAYTAEQLAGFEKSYTGYLQRYRD